MHTTLWCNMNEFFFLGARWGGGEDGTVPVRQLGTHNAPSKLIYDIDILNV